MQEIKLTVASSPHVRCNETIPKIMWNVVAALVPAAAFGVYYFGVNALVNIIVAIVSAVILNSYGKGDAQTHHHYRRLRCHHRPSVGYDLSSEPSLVDEHRRFLPGYRRL